MVVAHGMGARLVIEAVGGEAETPMAAVAPPRGLRFVFVAPDVRADVFKQRLARFPAGTLRTMYCNSNDQVRARWASDPARFLTPADWIVRTLNCRSLVVLRATMRLRCNLHSTG